MGLPPRYRSILLAEDDLDVRECLADVLLEAGCTVVQALDGADALTKLDEVERPCLILLDLVMPRIGGVEFLERLREHPHASDFSVLLMSASPDPSGAEDYPGVVGMLRKPFDVDELLSGVGAHS
ncbi:MAG TPA: response regulator [Myxococcaceae bacterium]|nr:response regulator [Myxococcaceae bacterium]